MTIETEVAALTTATTSLLTAVNVSKTTLDTKVADATTQAGTATTQSGIAITQATNAAASAALALTRADTATTQASAATAAAVGASNIVLGVSTLYPAIRPSLDLDFANSQTFDPRITFTRASTATRTNSRGLVELVPSGVPRIDFDAVTGACKGLLIEEQRANLLTFSEAFDNAVWTPGASAATVVSNALLAPDGAITADLLNATSIDQIVQQVASIANDGVTRTFSFFLKQGTALRTAIRMIYSGGTGLTAYATVDWATKTISQTYAVSGVSVLLIDAGNGCFRAAVSSTNNASGNTSLVCRVLPGGESAVGGTTGTVYAWGAQLEAGAFPTSYIPTVASQVTRAADVATMTGANFSSWYRQDEGSFVAGYNALQVTGTTASQVIFEANNGAALDVITIFKRPNADVSTRFQVAKTGSANPAFLNLGVFTTGPHALSAAYKLNNAVASFGGGVALSDVAVDIPSVDRLFIGSSVAGTAQFLNGHIRSISYYPKALTSAELQALSTQ